MKKLYIAPETEVFIISENDVIRTSLSIDGSNHEDPVIGYTEDLWF